MSNLGLSAIAPGSDHPEVVANGNFDRLDNALTEAIEVDLSSNNAALTVTQLQSGIFFNLNGAAAARSVTLPTIKRTVFFMNNGTADVTLTLGTASIVVKAGKGASVRLTGAANGLIDISGAASSTPANPLPPGGTTGQVLAKNSNTNYDVSWADDKQGTTPVYELPAGGSTGQILAKASAADRDVAWVNPPSGGGGSATITEAGVRGSALHRYWRVLVLNSNNDVNGQRYFAAAEIAMRNTPAGANLATGGTASSRSNWSGQPASNAFDGNDTTYYETGGDQAHAYTTTNLSGNWLAYDFGTPVAINVVRITNPTVLPNERIIGGVIQWSDNGTAWSDAWYFQKNNTANGGVTTHINPYYDNKTVGRQNFTLAQANALSSKREGDDVFIIDGRKVGEAAGAGTGVPCYWSNGFFRTYSNDAQVTT